MSYKTDTPKRKKESTTDTSFEASPIASEQPKKTRGKHKKAKGEENQKPITDFVIMPSTSNTDISSQLARIELKLSQLVTKEDLQVQIQNLVTKNELARSIGIIAHKYDGQIDDLKQEHKKDIEELKGQVLDLENKNRKLDSEIEHLKTVNERSRYEMDSMHGDIESNIAYLNDLQQHGRANSIRISGLQDTNKDETTDQTVLLVTKLCNELLDLQIHPKDIDIAHRLGQFNQKRPRNIICKFVRRTSKLAVVASRKQLKGKGIVICEDLTPYNQHLLTQAFQTKGIQNTWSVNGKLMVKRNDGKTARISCEYDIEKFLESF